MEEIERGFSIVGGRKIIWLEGDASEPITSGHADGYLLFTKPSAILVEEIDSEGRTGPNRSKDVDTLRNVVDRRGRLIQRSRRATFLLSERLKTAASSAECALR